MLPGLWWASDVELELLCPYRLLRFEALCWQDLTWGTLIEGSYHKRKFRTYAGGGVAAAQLQFAGLTPGSGGAGAD